MTKRALTAFTVTLTLLATALMMNLQSSMPAYAAEPQSHTSDHGGIVAEAGHHHLELVARDGSLEVYLTHSDGDKNAEDVSTSKATATVLSEGKKIDIVLQPEAGGVFRGTGAFKAVKGTTIVVTLTITGHDTEQARFKLE
ncbi:MAG: hypothetical protein ACRCS9_01940 [Hyphomicrobium sp.]